MNFKEAEIIPLQLSNTNASPKRAQRADAIANRALILGTAQQLFAEHGVTNICMTAIAEAAGVGKGTLYRGFANKGELCLALLDEDMRIFQNKIIQIFRDKYDQPALTRLDTFLDHLVRFMDFHAPLLREVQMQEASRSFETAEQTSSQKWSSWLHATIGLLLQQAQQNGETSDLDIPYLVDAILAPLNADLFIYQREILGFELERISRGLRQLVSGGCNSRVIPGA
jgi:AcrR family transcriptional regulator